MRLSLSRVVLVAAVVSVLVQDLLAQEQDRFELPVQLIGFPVIILAVRASNFVKKLAYSLNPRTYSRRSRRDALDMDDVEKRLVAEFGPDVCVYPSVCDLYAQHAQHNEVLDWEDVFRAYKDSPERSKQSYLLSVFLGDIVASHSVCQQVAKRRPCDRP